MKTKKCSVCGIEKPLADFPFRNKQKGTYRAECKECHCQQVKKRYYHNKELINNTKQGKKCIKCGYNKCLAALEYHHIIPNNKKDTIARLSTHANINDALQETNKCILLCANCHREFHYLHTKYGITLEDFLK